MKGGECQGTGSASPRREISGWHLAVRKGKWQDSLLLLKSQDRAYFKEVSSRAPS